MQRGDGAVPGRLRPGRFRVPVRRDAGMRPMHDSRRGTGWPPPSIHQRNSPLADGAVRTGAVVDEEPLHGAPQPRWIDRLIGRAGGKSKAWFHGCGSSSHQAARAWSRRPRRPIAIAVKSRVRSSGAPFAARANRLRISASTAAPGTARSLRGPREHAARERHLAHAAVEEACAQARFEVLNGARHAGMHEVERGCGGGEVADLGPFSARGSRPR